MDRVKYGGWNNNIRLRNREIELIITGDVGPRIIRCGFIGKMNLLGELKEQRGGTRETAWMIRGGHRLWIAPEAKPRTYELDNVPISVRAIAGGIRTVQEPGPLTGVQKSMEISLSSRRNEVRIQHTLTNRGRKAVTLAPWALTVMTRKGTAIIPLPPKIAHTKRLTHNQEWSVWGYTDFADPRWTWGSRFILFRQDPKRGPNKLGIAHREGWVAYLVDGFLFVKRFSWTDGATYPDGGVNFETFSNEAILELESLGPLVTLKPGKSARHEERWFLFSGVKAVRTEADVWKHVVPRVKKTRPGR